jgi:hypothetical protein
MGAVVVVGATTNFLFGAATGEEVFEISRAFVSLPSSSVKPR